LVCIFDILKLIMAHRIGIGYDIHRLVEGRKLFLGGVEIPYIKGLLGHSDGDALLHAICDALLGALAKGDIGEHFPDTDVRFQDVSSIELLKAVNDITKQNNYIISCLDTVIIAQEPVLAPFKKQMRQKIASVLSVSEDCVNIKAKTAEGLGEIGKKEAIACYAVVMLELGGIK
jgi:2-C-methyl-D-erythritol 2,4-cyclodiphosphate synthase